MKLIQLTQLTVASSLALAGFASATPQELVDKLGDESYQLREKAEQELTLWAKERGQEAIDELSDLKKKSSSPEVQSRLDNVLSGVHVYEAVPGTQGFIGISMQPFLGGSVITGVSPDTPAERAGLRANDRIVELDGIDLSEKNNDAEEATDFLRMYVRSKKSGEKLSIKIDRNGKILTKDLKLADYNTEVRRLDPFGDERVIPLNAMRVVPQGRMPELNDPRQFAENQKQLLELNLLLEQQLLRGNKVPEDFKEMLKRHEEQLQKRQEQLKEQRNLKQERLKELEEQLEEKIEKELKDQKEVEERK